MRYGSAYGMHAETVHEVPTSYFNTWMNDWQDKVGITEEERGLAELPDFRPIEDPLWRLRFSR